MVTRFAAVLICGSLLWLTGCGGVVFFAGTTPGVASIIVVSGTCVSVQLASIVENGTFVAVTTVVLLVDGLSRTFNFCGDVSGRFPLNRTLTVNFSNGSTCATPVSIVIVGL